MNLSEEIRPRRPFRQVNVGVDSHRSAIEVSLLIEKRLRVEDQRDCWVGTVKSYKNHCYYRRTCLPSDDFFQPSTYSHAVSPTLIGRKLRLDSSSSRGWRQAHASTLTRNARERVFLYFLQSRVHLVRGFPASSSTFNFSTESTTNCTAPQDG